MPQNIGGVGKLMKYLNEMEDLVSIIMHCKRKFNIRWSLVEAPEKELCGYLLAS